jgi:hypothetical protein
MGLVRSWTMKLAETNVIGIETAMSDDDGARLSTALISKLKWLKLTC